MLGGANPSTRKLRPNNGWCGSSTVTLARAGTSPSSVGVFVEKFARRARLEAGARAAAGHGARCAELSKKAWYRSAKRSQVFATYDLICS